jgi:hypothetical protein
MAEKINCDNKGDSSEIIRLTPLKQTGHSETHWQWTRAWRNSMFVGDVNAPHWSKSKAVPLHAMEALGGRGGSNNVKDRS